MALWHPPGVRRVVRIGGRCAQQTRPDEMPGRWKIAEPWTEVIFSDAAEGSAQVRRRICEATRLPFVKQDGPIR